MEPGFAAPSAGAEEGHGLADAFDSVIRDLRSSKQLSTQDGGGPISPNKVSPPLAKACILYSIILLFRVSYSKIMRATTISNRDSRR